MPPSKQARSAQHRQKERLAIAGIAKQRAQRRRRVIGSIITIMILLGFSGLLYGLTSNDNKKVVAPPPVSTTTTIPGPKTCVKLADKLPKGAPNVPVQVGPAPTKLIQKDLVIGKGDTVPPGVTVTVNYIGVACSTGKIFDSSWSRGQPATFGLDGVIKGWTDGIPGMKVGGRRLLGIPADQAYGAAGNPPSIGPNEPLWFVVDMVKIGSITTTTTAPPASTTPTS